ncbi:phosphoramidate cytidylyltransferase [Campylobacter insulaenigrae]|uniref:Phosphoramidate cytidylyltransferase n=1 Tax=Campylobacter insulaenigrae NCTC 12927 TaxID=1031564 RepID=W5ZRQ3_9BACT|nr:phosphoramidate cytidylyltransferase [Campylobacter insulaenigrae]AHI44358.1 phosphoramidate cytidylyltransferase [Campylobacter insulaenigrae NCTC 12927]AJC87306.1 phosphoramidate cytidylyltransferase [Campylobacter insulaenigrae NCTC 12927]VEH93170.1 Putative sugar nucleotidyltransferase [Campylobacter insulaenigrae]
MNTLILAAGLGSRLMPLTQNSPKCMVEYKDQKIIDYELQALNDVNEIGIVGGYLFDTLKNYIKNKYDIKFFYENKNYDKTNMVYSLFCAKDFLQRCIEQKQDLLISYADIVYFKDAVLKLQNSQSDFSILVDENWKELWDKRFTNPLDDAESLIIKNDLVIELGKKTCSYDQIHAQYMGLFKFSYTFLQEVMKVYNDLDRNILYDGKDFNNMYMTSFLQLLIDKYNNAQALKFQGQWMEIDSIDDLKYNAKFI